MAREAALSVRLGLDDSELRRKIRAQGANYNDLLRENRRFKEQLSQQNSQARVRELAEDKKHHAALVAENRKFAQQNLAGGTRALPEIQRMQRAMITGSGVRPGAGGGSGNTATNSGMGMLMLSQTIDDMQYGLKGIVNNIAPLVMALGGSTGLAGALTIATVAINQGASAWARWTGETKMAEENAKAMASHAEKLAQRVSVAGERGAAGGAFHIDELEREDRGRAGQDASLSREQRLLDITTQLKLVEAERLEGSERLQAVFTITSEADQKRLESELKTARERLNADSEKFASLSKDAKAMEKELAAFKAREDAIKAQNERTRLIGESAILSKEKRRKDGSLGNIFTTAEGMFGYDPYASDREKLKADTAQELTPAEKERMAFLQARLPKIQEARGRVEKRAGESLHRVDNLEQELGPEAVAKEKIHQEKIAQVREKAQQEFLDRLRNFGVQAGRAFMEKMGEEMEKGRKLLAQKASREQISGNLQIAELRMQGRDKQADALEKESFLKNRTEALKKEGFSDQDAADIASREHAVSTAKPARKKIRGVKSANRKSGLDGEFLTGSTDFDGFQDMSQDYFGLKEAGTQKRTQQNQKLKDLNQKIGQAAAAGDNPTVQELKTLKQELLQKQDELITAVKGTTGNQIKPAGTN